MEKKCKVSSGRFGKSRKRDWPQEQYLRSKLRLSGCFWGWLCGLQGLEQHECMEHQRYQANWACFHLSSSATGIFFLQSALLTEYKLKGDSMETPLN